MTKLHAIGLAILAAAFYALNVPASKVLLRDIGPATMAALLYLGAGIGISALSLVFRRGKPAADSLERRDLPFVAGMILLDVAAPILLMFGLACGASSSAALLGNFEIVATTAIALLLFHEAVSRRLWAGIALITLASILLSVDDLGGVRLSRGSLFVLAATACWGLENNCTRALASKDTFQIVSLKGVFSGLGALGIALVRREAMPAALPAASAMALGFVAYGLSIFFYVRAQAVLGAAKTSAYYATAPFIAAFLSFACLKEPLTGGYLLALAAMAAGTAFVVVDTLVRRHSHPHRHTYAHVHGGTLHVHTIVHTHEHSHFLLESRHRHHHAPEDSVHEHP